MTGLAAGRAVKADARSSGLSSAAIELRDMD